MNEIAMISISDTGSGIAAEELLHVFARGYRTLWRASPVFRALGWACILRVPLQKPMADELRYTACWVKGSCFHVTLPCRAASEVLSPSLQRDARIN
jgi:K+-sensing histidine kinase KdpD